MNNRTKSMIRSLGCRIVDDENINCHGSNIQIIQLPEQDMYPERIRSFCGSQTIELSNDLKGPDETSYMYNAMKHQLGCKHIRDIRKMEMKMRGIPVPSGDKGDTSSGLGTVAKAAGSKMKSGFKKYFTGGTLLKEGREELELAGEELKDISMKEKLGDLLKRKEEISLFKKPGEGLIGDALLDKSGSSASFSVNLMKGG